MTATSNEFVNDLTKILLEMKNTISELWARILVIEGKLGIKYVIDEE